MDTLKKEIAVLMQCSDFNEIEKQLQVINKLIVTNYMFELSNGLRIYPIEVEAYFKDAKFNEFNNMFIVYGEDNYIYYFDFEKDLPKIK